MNRRRMIAALAVASCLTSIAAANARADGLPAPDVLPAARSVAAPGSGDRYVAVDAVRGSTIARLATTGELIASRALREDLVIPGVAYDGSAAGLSANGGTLVLIRPRVRFPQRRTSLTVLDADGLRIRDRIELPGDFSFDAISPDGSRIYLVEYPNPTDPTTYLVRAYDVEAGRLLREPILDPEEDPGEMRGYPLTRATSPDGRWAYTLYDGGGEHPFIHALDTVDGRTVCIDVHRLAGHPVLRDFFPRPITRFALANEDDGSRLSVLDRGAPVAVVDTETFEVSDPGGGTGVGLAWVAGAAVLALLGAAASRWTVWRRSGNLAATGTG